MKLPLSWLKAHLETDEDAETVAERLTAIGLEVEGIEDKARALGAFTVARVVSAEPHPNASKLRVLMVDTGRETVQVVCGAPNARAGLTGVFAPPGTFIPGSNMTLSVAKIRGVESFGMMCSERELLLSEAHEGIIELGDDAVPGMQAAAALGMEGALIEVNVTPNRGDCTHIFGIARDLAAAGLGILRPLRADPVKGRFPSPIGVALDFDEAAKTACPLFAGRFVRGVKNGPSPAWLQERLKSIGLRPISALVDVTNFLSHDCGRPLHVFDAAKLSGNVRARLAKQGETLRALDGKTYTLDGETIVIADERRALGMAGIMGGEETSCTAETADVFIESALFDPVRIARAGRTLGILSEARYRFERGVDPEFVVPGLELATALILELCGGEPSEAVIAGAPPPWRRTVSLPPGEVRRSAGVQLASGEIVRILTKLGFGVEGGDPLRVSPPSWRADVHGTADLVEEIVRIHGLDSVPSTPMTRPNAIARPVLTSGQRHAGIARRTLAARGFHEGLHFSFVPRAHAALFGGGDEARQLENPISTEMESMRPSLLPSLLAAVARNQARGVNEMRLFEIAGQYAPDGGQTLVAAGLVAGTPSRHWTKPAPFDVYAIKADALAALEAAWGQPVNLPVERTPPSWYHPGRSGTLKLGSKPLAAFGALHPRIVAAFDLKGEAVAFELFLDAIPEAKAKKGRARPPLDLSDFPAVERDFAFIVDAAVTAEEIVRAARAADRVLIEQVSVFDVYEGKGVPAGQKSVAISTRLQPKDRTLTDPEIEVTAQKIIASVMKATGGTLRS